MASPFWFWRLPSRAVDGPLALDQPVLVGRFRDALVAAGFEPERIGEALGAESEVLSRSVDIPVQLRRLEGRGGLASLVRLFVLNVDVPLGAVSAAVAPLEAADLARLGVVQLRDAVARPLVRIVPHAEVLITSDVRLYPGQSAPQDHVPGVHRPSVTLAYLTVRSPARNFLDLATGCGIEAILAAPQAKRVLATDVSARALNYATFNAQLNGVRNIEFRLGSWFTPLGDERFEVIACNPPYVISPSTDFLFRDSGLPGDSVSELVVRGIPAHLEEGGFATIAISWVVDPDAADDGAPVRRWVEGSGCDAWLLHYRTDEPLATAAGWNQTEAGDPVRHAALIDSWMAYYREQGIRAIAYGSLVLRRRSSATNWFRVDRLPPVQMRPASDHILRIFAAHDFLTGIDDEGLLEARVATVPTLRLEQRVKFADGAPQIEAMNVTVDEGVGFQAVIEPRAVLLLSRLDGRRTLRDALFGAAEAERTPAEANERYMAAGLKVVRRMLELGMLARA